MTTPIQTASPGYLDFSGLAQLRGDAAQKKSGSLDKAAEQFEALFVQMMLKSMRESVVKDEENTSQAADMYQDLMDRELSVQFAKRRTLGIADMLTRQLTPPATTSTQALLEGRQSTPVGYPLRPGAVPLPALPRTLRAREEARLAAAAAAASAAAFSAAAAVALYSVTSVQVMTARICLATAPVRQSIKQSAYKTARSRIR